MSDEATVLTEEADGVLVIIINHLIYFAPEHTVSLRYTRNLIGCACKILDFWMKIFLVLLHLAYGIASRVNRYKEGRDLVLGTIVFV